MISTNVVHFKDYVFGLDIGTRSIVGIVGYKDKEKFHVIGHAIEKHETRAMIDGQIHDIQKVSETVNKVKVRLEKQLNIQLSKVCIAAAGRVLKTCQVHVEETIPATDSIKKEMIYALELKGIEEAHRRIQQEIDQNDNLYHCVGYSVIKYFLNDYAMTSLEGHKGSRIGADLIATFLPGEVVDSMYAVIQNVGLEVAHLTLEPIAAIQVAIPEQYRLLNIALVDIGAGTSDIAITKEGSIVAYGMIPFAGDEITEQIVHTHLVDFQTAENMKLKLGKNRTITFKDIMGISHKIESKVIIQQLKPTLERLAVEISHKLKDLNGGKSTNAVFCVGGGGLINNFTTLLAKNLSIANERVALRGIEVLDHIDVYEKRIKGPDMVTPIGICLTGLEAHRNDFIEVWVNGEKIRIFDHNHLTLMDVAAYKGFNHKNLIARRGKDLVYKLNGENKKARGSVGTPAQMLINEEQIGLNHVIRPNDKITLISAQHGQPPELTIKESIKALEPITYYIDGKRIELPYKISVNGMPNTDDYKINQDDQVEAMNSYTVKEVLELSDIHIKANDIYVNNKQTSIDTLLLIGDHIETHSISSEKNSLSAVEDPSSKNEIRINVNNEEVLLKDKKDYVFVDIFDAIDFNLNHPKGQITCLLNGNKASYLENIKDGDIIKVFWA